MAIAEAKEMADKSGVLDNSWQSTQRLINSSFSTQTFSNTTGDSSYSLDPNDTNDYFHLKLTQRSSLILTLTNLSGDADLSLLDNSGIAMQTSSNGGVLAEAITTTSPLDPGDYYIQIFTPDNSTTVSQYTLNVNTVPTSRTDLLWRNYTTGQNIVWQMNSSSIGTKVSINSVSDSNWKIQAAGDMDGDGTPDYIWRNASTGQDVVWLMDGTSRRSTVYIKSVTDANWNIEGAADFNGDGSTDLLWRNNSTGQNLVWLMNGLTFSTSITLQSLLPSTYQIGAVADFNGDSKPDIVWRNYDGSGQNLIWIMNGVNYSYSTSLRTVTGNWNIIGAGDLNSDGNSDLVWQYIDSNGSQNLIWYMNKTSSVSNAYTNSVSDPNWKMATSVTTSPIADLAGNSMSTAFDIGTLNDTGSYSDKLSVADRNEYYKFKLVTSSTVNLSLTGLSANADLWLIWDKNNNSIYDSGDVQYTSVNLGTADEQFSNLSLATGTYFLRVFTPTTETGSTTYTLNVGAAAGQPIDLLPASPTSSTFTIVKTNGSALPLTNSIPTISLKSSNSTYVPSIKINYQVKNSSVSITPTQFKVNFYLSRDNNITSSDLLLSQVDSNNNVTGDAIALVNNLAPNQTYSGSMSVAVPTQSDNWWGGDQTYYIGMIIDQDGQVAETSEVNNTAATALGIKDTLRPDLIGGGLTIAQTSATPGQSIRVTGTIKNIGNVSTNSDFFVRFYFSNDDTIDGSDWVFPGTVTIKAIAANSSTTFDSNSTSQSNSSYFPVSPFVLPDSTWEGWKGNGRYYVAMELNVLGAVLESSGGLENNSNYGKLIGQYIDYNFIDITGAPTNQVV